MGLSWRSHLTPASQDSTIIEADPGLPTEEDARKRREIEEKKAKEKGKTPPAATAAVVETRGARR